MVSAIGGMLGNSGDAFGRLCAIARTRFALTCDITAGAGVSVQCDSPDTIDATDGPPPLYGTCRQSMCAICRKYAPDMWLCEPLPADAILRSPGFAFACAMRSFTDLIGTDGFTTSTFGVSAN